MEKVLPLLSGGLILFLYAIIGLSKSMQDISTERAKIIITKYTSNLFLSLAVGTVLTIILGSSSAVIILAIVFINAQSLSFNQAIGIIMGANIGTTFSSQLITLEIGSYAAIPMLAGLLMHFFKKTKRFKYYGDALVYFGMLFFGLFIIEQSVLPLRDSELFMKWIVEIGENHVEGTLIGALVTLIIQSSSATVGIAIILGKQNLISLAGGVAIMLGAELGTCSDTLLATIGGSRQALKASLFHLSFNLIMILIGLLIFDNFVSFIRLISEDKGLEHQIANAHMLFNILGVIAFLPFVEFSINILNRMLPEKSSTDNRYR